MKLLDWLLDTPIERLFYLAVLSSLWVVCWIQLFQYEFGNALCLGVVTIAWKMKGLYHA